MNADWLPLLLIVIGLLFMAAGLYLQAKAIRLMRVVESVARRDAMGRHPAKGGQQ